MVSHDDLVFGAYLVGVCVSFPLIMMLVIVNVQLFPLLDQFGVPCPAFLTGSWEGLFNAAVADPLTTYVVPLFPEPLANLATSLAQSRDALSDYVDAVALEGILWFQRVWENVGTLSCSEALQQGLVGLGLPEATVSTWFAQPFPYKEFVLGVALVVYLFETYLDYRQHRKLRERVRPATITTIVSQEDFEKANEYGLDKSRFHFVRAFVNQLQTVALLWYDVLPLLWDLVGSTMLHYAGLGSEYEITHSVLFFMFTALLTSVLSIPFDFYHTFVIEERHGFNKQTPALYFTDLVKNYLVGAVIGVPVIAALLRIVQWAGPYFYVYIWVFVMGLQFLLMTIYPTLIQPLFNKFTPLPEGDLRSQIEALAARLKFPLTKLYVVDGSKRSAHSNAYFYGFFKNKRIVLYDTLLEHANTEEICAVLGHELGHWKKNHVFTMLVAIQTQMFVLFYLFSRVIHNQAMYASFGFHHTTPLLIGFMLFQYLYFPVESLVSFAMNVMSRHNEFEADAFAVNLGYVQPLSSALIKLQLKNLGNMNPDPWYSAYHYSHPPLVERLEAMKRLGNDQSKKSS